MASDGVSQASHQPSTTAEPRVCVAVLTYQRPRQLAAVLPLVIDQAAEVMSSTQGHQGAWDTIRVLVVDNDATGSAGPAVTKIASTTAVRVDHVVEEAPGISAARNRALDEAAEEDLLVFVDDDELPRPGWLAALLDAHARYDVAAVAGPVIAGFETDPGHFLRGGGFFELDRHRSGEEIEEVGSGNLLLDLRRLRAHGIRFDAAYGLSGGEDTKLCRDLRAAGERIVWCDEAVVDEPVAPERATASYAARRTVRQGSGWARLRLEDTPAGLPRLRRRAGYVLRGGGKLARGGAQAGLARVRGDGEGVGAGAKEALGGLGIVASALGVQLDGYQRNAPLAGLDVRTEPRVHHPRPVTVGVPTYKRTDLLADLLQELLPQAAALHTSGSGLPGDAGRQVRVVIVDNDPEGSARDTVEQHAARHESLDVRYLHEPRPGVVAVRNTIIDNALLGGYLACIDDDEVPCEGWLADLVATGERTGAAVVSGRVDYQLGEDAEEWVARSRHFDAAEHTQDQELTGGSSANLLLDLHQLRVAGLRFDEGYSLTGGEDTRLLRDVLLAGGRIVAAPNARTREGVPADRATRAWVLKRAERNAESWARVRADVRPGEGERLPLLRRPKLAARGLARGAKGVVKLADARRTKDTAALARAELYLAGAKGLLRGAAGINREEYARPKN